MNERRTFRCPSCSILLPAGSETPPHCPRCRLLLRGPIAAELETVDRELAVLGRRSSDLVARRFALLAQLQPVPVGAAASSWTTAGSAAETPSAGVPVQTTLLALGALLLSVAGTIFTVLTWGHLDIAGRAAVLVLGTVVAAGTSAVLHRRGLRASADAVAVLTLVLGALDLHALRLLAAPEIDVLAWWSGAGALLAAAGATVGIRLRLPALLTAAVGVAQVVLPLATLAALVAADGSDLRGALAIVAVALAGTASLDLGARYLSAGKAGLTDLANNDAWLRPARRTLQVAALAALALAGALAAGAALVVDTWEQAVPGTAALLVVAAGWTLLALLTRTTGATVAAGAAAGHLVLAATSLVLPVVVAGSRTGSLEAGLLVPTVFATLLLLVVPLLPAHLRTGPRLVGTVTVGLTMLAVLDRVLVAAGIIAAQLRRPWPDPAPVTTSDVVRTAGVGTPDGTLLALLAVGAVTIALAGRGLDVAAARVARGVSAGLWVSAGLGFPVVVALPVPLALVAMLVPTVALLVPILLGRVTAPNRCLPLLVAAVPFATAAVAWAAAGPVLTVLTLGLLAALTGALAQRRDDGRDPIATATTAVATLLALALVPVSALAVGTGTATAGALLAAAAAVVVVAVDRPAPQPARVAALGASAAAVTVGTAMSAIELGLLSLVLGGLAVAALALTLRPGRAPAAVFAGGFATAAVWVRLADAGVTLPEAYTLPPAVLALVVGETVRRRRADLDPSLLLTPGLVLALFPTLLISLAEPDAIRAALLSAGATAVVVAGSAARLRAPLLLGGLVLATVALRQLAPLAAVTPRWVLLGGLGLILLTLGVRYERARADLGRLRRSFARLS